MTEPDGGVAKRYREIAREEPSASVDASILAAARRAVAPLPFARRWAVPVSIAAVVMLAVGVTLEMQHEEPGVETVAPREALPRMTPPPAPKEAMPAAPLQTMPAAPPAAAPQAAKRARPAPSGLSEEKRTVAEPAAPAPTSAAPAASTPAATAPVPAASAPAPAAPPAAMLQKRERAAEDAQGIAAARTGVQAQGAAKAGDPARELERIATLRSEGRVREADEALAQFRRDHPGYEIPAATWERVRPR